MCVCVPALLFWRAVWCVGWSGLGGGVLPLFSGLHALDLQFLNSKNKTGIEHGTLELNKINMKAANLQLHILKGNSSDFIKFVFVS